MQASAATTSQLLPPVAPHHLVAAQQQQQQQQQRLPPQAHSRTHSPVPPHLYSRGAAQQPRHRSSHGSGDHHHSSRSPHSHRSTHGHQHHRSSRPHHEARERYDPDYDRTPTAVPTAAAAAAASSSRELFNPNSASSRRPASPAASLEHPHPHRTRRDDAHSGAGAVASSSSSRAPRSSARSKREPVDPADLGRRAGAGSGSGLVAARSGAGQSHQHRSGSGASGARGPGPAQGSKESLESVETDFSGRTRSSGGGGGGRRRRRREDGDEADEADLAGVSAAGGGPGAAAKSRQLFDPRRDDPMRFAEARAERAARHGAGAKGGADARSLASGSVLSFASDATGATNDDAASGTAGASGKRPPHPAMAPLKRAYREITDLEGRVAEEHRAAQAQSARDGGDADEFAGGLGGSGKAGVRIQGAAGGAGRARFDDEYWVRLASLHKQCVSRDSFLSLAMRMLTTKTNPLHRLADAHYSFLQLALDPRLPASLHSLAQRYNIPTRLWQVGFHQLLERMRHAVLSAPLSGPDDTGTSTNVLEHLIEFIQYAYGFYSQLFEDPTIAVFRAAWIEQLGDLARYRMAVAGLASRMHAASHASSSSPPQSARLTAAALESNAADAKPARPADAASIGQAALHDWDLEEHETWREMARDWYGQGLAENPGTGRLQHHLALLSKGDELRALYHYSKRCVLSSLRRVGPSAC